MDVSLVEPVAQRCYHCARDLSARVIVSRMSIRVLDPNVASKIAAGEVVERPASVVKELVENSIDAGATGVTIEVQNGGMKLVRVTDDGEGIPILDLEVAVERHATSKIFDGSDLESIDTMGFRGEALPSIASVSRLILTSRARGEDQGAYVLVNGGVMERKGAAGTAEGTVVAVHDLFFNVPARRKFLRSESAEAGRIHNVVTQLALAHPHVRLRLVSIRLENKERERYASPGNGSLLDVLATVYNREVTDQLLEISGSDIDRRHAWGYVSSPSIHRANRAAINFFVNRRWVQSRLLLQAVEEAYRGLLMLGRHPVATVQLDLPLAEVDVNVHPAKREVRFHHEGSVFSLVQRVVREALVTHSPVPLVTPQPTGRRATVAQYRGEMGPRWSKGGELPLWPIQTRDEQRREEDVQGREGQEGLATPGATDGPATVLGTLPALRVLGQAGNTYIIAEGPQGVYLLDQHAAHERVRYEQVMRQVKSRHPEVQGLLEPMTVELLPGQLQALRKWEDMLADYGFQGEPFGDSAYLLRGVPVDLRDTGPEKLLGEVLDILDQARDPAQAGDSVTASIACHSSVRAGDTLTHQEMVALVRQLEVTDAPHTCPHGRPTMLHLSAGNLEREFGRR
jgi:DNA mismatch repair protein MutL